jgi:RNA polymerase sigma factor (sigma-70 family)
MERMEEEADGSSKQAEAILYKQAQAGCRDSLNILLEQNEGLVWYVVKRQHLWGLPMEEAGQAGRRGLWRAVLGYDPERGVKFVTYAYLAIMRHVWNAVKSHLRRQRREINMGVLRLYYYQTAPDPAMLQGEAEIRFSLQELLERMPERLRQVIVARYGLDGQGRQSHAKIAEQMGVSGKWVRLLEIEALVWLRQPAHSQELRSMLARHSQQQYELADQLAQAWLRRRGGRNGRS